MADNAQNDDIPFNRDFPLKPGVADEVRPGVRRFSATIRARSPSPERSATSWQGQGCDHRSRPRRRGPCGGAADAVAGDRDAYPVTHTHRDHSPNTGGSRPPPAPRSMPRVRIARRGRATRARRISSESGADRELQPDLKCATARRRRSGWALQAWRRRATANHLAFAWRSRNTCSWATM